MSTSGRDDDVIEAALAAVRDARERAPRDYLLGIAAVLATVAAALLVAAALTSGGIQDLLLNLSAEVAGAWLTLVLVDGLLQRLQLGTSASLDAMAARLEERRGQQLSPEERSAWARFADAYWALAGRRSPAGRLRSAVAGRRQLDELEAEGNRTLAEFRADAETALPRA